MEPVTTGSSDAALSQQQSNVLFKGYTTLADSARKPDIGCMNVRSRTTGVKAPTVSCAVTIPAFTSSIASTPAGKWDSEGVLNTDRVRRPN